MKDWLSTLKLEIKEENNLFEIIDKKLAIRYLEKLTSEESKTNYEKYKQFKENGIHLITIFKSEWLKRQEQYKNYISSILGISHRKIYGRKCEIKNILFKSQAKLFIDENHIQGSNNLGVVFFGIFYEGELLGIMSLGRHNREIKNKNVIVLDRLCFKNGVQVIGGASKLFKACVKWAEENKYYNIISFSDNKWSQGNIYNVLGFELDEESRPDYFYIDENENILSKQSQKKQSVNCPEHMTEYEWAESRGLTRCWDCGKKRWNYNLNSEKPTHKEILSRNCSIQHAAGVFKNAHIHGYFYSAKNDANIYYASSYEERCIYLLEQDINVKKFDRGPTIKIGDKSRNPDFIVEYMNGKIELIEVKYLAALSNLEVINQIEESRQYAKSKNYSYRVWTEIDSGLENEKAIIAWAKNFNKTGQDFSKISNQKHCERQQKYYSSKVKNNKIELYCDFCNENHEIMLHSYNLNVKKNGKYVCLKENGSIIGKKEKKKKINPFAIEGKKQCNKCKEVKLFEFFNLDKSRTDGYCNKCRDCNKKYCLDNYYGKQEN